MDYLGLFMYQCLKPNPAVSTCKIDGKHHLKFLPRSRPFSLIDLRYKYGSENVFLLPCGQCESCRRNKSIEWSIRCFCEAQMHPFNYFLTLTYDDIHLSKASKEDVNKFFDNLSGFHHVNKFKFFGCMEYGEETHRLHYHIVLFCDFEIDLYDATKINKHYYYHSKKIDSLWKYGLYNIAPFEHNCSRYVAKYSSKTGSKLFMSRNLGKSYCDKHCWELINDNFVIYGNFGDKFRVLLPSVMLNWFSTYKDITIDKKKEIARLITAQRMREIGSIHEESVIYTDINKLNEMPSKRRLL